jgi:hypothetical protein
MQRGGGAGGDRPSLLKEKSRAAYSIGIKGCVKEVVGDTQIMSIFGVSGWRSDFVSVDFALLTI